MATYTQNYNLEKPDLNETADIEVINNNMDIIDASLHLHTVDILKHIPYAVTTNVNNEYTANLGLTELIDGQRLQIKCNADSTGQVTLNPDGIGIKNVVKANGIPVSNWKANGIYTLAYNATTGNFISQGEGGEYGTATPDDVKMDVPFGTEDGIKIGTYTSDATATAADIIVGKIAYSMGQRLIGTNNNKRWISGTFDAGYSYDGSTQVNVYGLPFKPRLVYIYGTRTSPGTYFQYILLVDTPFLSRTGIKGFYTYMKPGTSMQSSLIASSSYNFQILSTGFTATFYATTSDTWIACDYVAFE
ncbi:hypothetical protein [Ruminiclostridium josui]|uniref:hypothetical protein n=1 Tax=Ruminiclostridium josui TaxID=1499 RepID=UPI0004649066|nr:hypothetical protein [Ruminiclostridium josui]